MTSGRLVAVVGPSGVGKDSVMAGVAAHLPDVRLVRRTITREAGLGGEDYDAATPATFEAMIARGAFAVHWNAHGLRYGIPVSALESVRTGHTCLANFSRSALASAQKVFPRLTVLNITASPAILARRLAFRGRENAQDIERRLSVAEKPLPPGLDVIELSNDDALETTVAEAVSRLQPVRG